MLHEGHRTLRTVAGATVALLAATLALTACGQRAPEAVAGDRLRVVATTTIVGDVVKQIGGDAITLRVLLPVGADPHSFEPTPQDIATVSRADVVFANGAGLETFLDSLLRNAGGKAERVDVSRGIRLRGLTERPEAAQEGEQKQEGADPHVWTDPNNVIAWTHNIEAALRRLDAGDADRYQANAEAYRRKLVELDAWVRAQVDRIPEGNRKLVTDHLALGYLAERYGLKQVGAIYPGFSTLAEPSSRELAMLEDAIRKQGVKAVFVGATANPNLARRVAADTGTRLVTLYTGSLTASGGEADNYLDYMRYNVSALVAGLG